MLKETLETVEEFIKFNKGKLKNGKHIKSMTKEEIEESMNKLNKKIEPNFFGSSDNNITTKEKQNDSN